MKLSLIFGFRWGMRTVKKTTPLELTPHIPHHPRQFLTIPCTVANDLLLLPCLFLRFPSPSLSLSCEFGIIPFFEDEIAFAGYVSLTESFPELTRLLNLIGFCMLAV